MSKYGIRHSDKCSSSELKEFREKVKNFIDTNNLPYKEIRSFNCFGGQVCIYTGEKLERMPLKLRRRLLAYRESYGKYVGKPEHIAELKKRDADELWERHNEPIIEVQKYSVYRADNWEEESDYLKEKMEKNDLC